MIEGGGLLVRSSSEALSRVIEQDTLSRNMLFDGAYCVVSILWFYAPAYPHDHVLEP